MSCKKLIESLRAGSEERIRLLWQEAEKQATAEREERAQRLARLSAEIERTMTNEARERSEQAESETFNQARLLRLSAERALSERLYRIAASVLKQLRKSEYEVSFKKMADELPLASWDTVRVNPADANLARKHFPGAEIVPDSGITGGMDVSLQGGAIRVVNTFEKRLERAWNDLLPELIAEAYREVHGGTPLAA